MTKEESLFDGIAEKMRAKFNEIFGETTDPETGARFTINANDYGPDSTQVDHNTPAEALEKQRKSRLQAHLGKKQARWR